MRIINFLLILGATAGLAIAQDGTADAGAGWAPEFQMAGRQIVALAEAIPAEKFGWRPAPGVRSVSEVLMHAASGNYFFLRSMGVKAGEDLPKNPEKTVTAKADVVRRLKASFVIDGAALRRQTQSCREAFLKALPERSRIRPRTFR